MGILGIDLGGGHVRAGLVRKGRVVRVETRLLDNKAGRQKIVRQILDAIDGMFDHSISGIGMGVPAYVKNGVVFDAGNIPAFQNIDLERTLKARYGVPVALNNDANCFALGQGIRKGIVVGLILGTGVGAGIVVDGKLLSGSHCGAGEFGRIPLHKGTVEDYCSGKFFLRRGDDGESLAAKAGKGQRAARQTFMEYGKHLGEALSIIVHSLDPDSIVLGGSVANSYKYFRKSMQASLKRQISPRLFRHLRISVSKKRHAAIIGAAQLVTK